MSTTSTTKQVSWALPLIKGPSSSSGIFSEDDIRSVLKATTCSKSTANASVDTEKPSGSQRMRVFGWLFGRSGSGRNTKVSDDATINEASIQAYKATSTGARPQQRYAHCHERERAIYEQQQDHRAKEILFADGHLEDPFACRWSAYCKFTDHLESTRAHLSAYTADRAMDTHTELFIALFVHEDLTYHSKRLLMEHLALPLVERLPKLQVFKFAVFFPIEDLEASLETPETLQYMVGALRGMKKTVILDGANTEMENRFVNKQHHNMRRLRYRHAEVRAESLTAGYLIPKAEADTKDSTRDGATKPIGIIRPERKQNDEAWIVEKRRGGIWPQ